MAGTDGETEYLGQTTYPSNPETGRRVFRTDIDGGTLMRYNGSVWEPIGSGGNVNDIPVQVSAPSTPTSPSTLTGLWYDSDYEPYATADYSSIGIRASKTASQSIPITTWTTLTTLNGAINKNTGGWTYNGTSHGWVVPQSGWYYAHARVHWAAYGSGNFRYHRITVNGSGLGDVAEEFSGLSTAFATQGSQLFYATAGDIIGVDAYQDAAAAVNVTWCNIEIALVGGTQGPKGDTGDVFTASNDSGIILQYTGASTSGASTPAYPAYDSVVTAKGDFVGHGAASYVTIPSNGFYNIGGYGFGTVTGTFMVRPEVSTDGGSTWNTILSASQENEATSYFRRVSVHYPYWLNAGDLVRTQFWSSTSISMNLWSTTVVRVGGVKGEKGDKGDTGNLPLQTAVQMRRSTAVSTSSGAWTKLTGFDVTVKDEGGTQMTKGTDQVTINVAGFYFVSIGGYWANHNAGTLRGLGLYANGAFDVNKAIQKFTDPTAGGYSSSFRTQTEGVRWFDVDDVITAYYYQDTGGALNFSEAYFTVAAIGGPKGDKGDTGNLPLNSGVNIGRTTNFNVTSSGVWTKLTGFDYNANWVDDNDDFTVNADDITVENAGYYDIFMKGFWANNNTGTLRGLRITINGSATIEEVHDGTDGYGFGFYQNASRTWYCNAGDTVGMYLYQDSGGAMNFSSAAFSIVRVGGPKGEKGDAGYVPEGDTAWRTPTLLNSWVNYDTTTYGPVGYRKDANGTVFLQGLVKNGSSASADMLTLPVGYRPSINLIFAGSAASTGYAELRVDSNGDVFMATGGSTSWNSIACSFKAAD